MRAEDACDAQRPRARGDGVLVQRGCEPQPAAVPTGHEAVSARGSAHDRAKPDGLVYIPFEQRAACLAETEVTALPGVGAALAQQLGALGVRTCAELRRKTRVGVGGRVEGRQSWRRWWVRRPR